MASNTDTKLDPAAEQVASSEPRLAESETKLATNPLHGDSAAKEDSKTEAATEAGPVC